MNRFERDRLTEDEIFLCNAADILRRSVETFECSLFSSLPDINNIYVLNVYKYIENQEKYHKRQNFKDEYLSFLDKFKITFEEKYVFENLI